MMLLHIGCGKIKHEGFINTDKGDMDISKPWPYEDDSINGIISMMVIQCLGWKDLVTAFREAHRVLRPGGVMRMGLFLVETNHPLETFLYGDNINLFSFDLLKNILVNRVGFSDIELCGPKQTRIPEFAQVDNRHHKGASYVEVVK